jgi:hypothetical protein
MNTKEKDLGASYIQRKDFITNKLKGSEPLNKIPIFSGTPNEVFVPVYMVDLNFPIYRLSNIRTKSAQETYISKNEIEKEFFKIDPECREALKIQHELLYEISISGGDEKNHYKTFENESFDKAHPMMMSDDGILINGNTRMSALRELYYSDPSKYERYEKVPIALLPSNLTEKDIRKLELNLQINPDIHKDYPWISEAMDCRDQLLLGRNERDIEIEYKRRQNEVSHPINLINELAMADLFLKLYDRVGEYDLLENDQYALLEWYRWRNQHKNNINRVNTIDIICFEIIKSKLEGYRENQKGDIYKEFKKLNKTFGDNTEAWENLFNQYKIDQNIENKSKNGKSIKDDNKSTYDFLIENLTIDNNANNNLSKTEETEIVKSIQNISKTKDRSEGIKIVETVQSVVGAFEETEKRNKNKKIINETVIESYEKINDCIRRLSEEEKEFELLEETLLEIEKTILHLNKLKDLILQNIK